MRARSSALSRLGPMRGWGSLYRTSLSLGLRRLLRHGYQREALIRLVVPLDPSRYLELPWVLEELAPAAGERVVDLASPKLLAVHLARSGVYVTAVDALEREIQAWRRLAAGERNLSLEVGDGRALVYPDASFDHGYSVSVIEHIEEPGDEQALAELARVVRPGGRVAITLPYASAYREDWRDRPVYVDQGGVDHGAEAGRFFFQRHYDDERLERLVVAVPELELVRSSVARLQPNWHELYSRHFPKLVPLGPFYGLLARERRGPGGDVVRLLFERR